MIRVTVECDGSKGMSEDSEGVQISEVFTCFERALRACGYFFKGSIDIVPSEDSDEN